MPRPKGQPISPQERVFAKEMAVTADKRYAAQEAGYSHPAQAAHKLLAREPVQAEIARQQVARLFSEALPAAVECLVGLIRNERAPAGARVQAAKVVMDRTLGNGDAAGSKEPHELTGEELAKAIADLEREASSRARDVTPAAAPEASIFA